MQTKGSDEMIRLRVLSAEEIGDPDLRAIMEASGNLSFGIYGHCPDLFRAFLQFLRGIRYGGRLPFAMKELVRLKIAELNKCRR